MSQGRPRRGALRVATGSLSAALSLVVALLTPGEARAEGEPHSLALGLGVMAGGGINASGEIMPALQLRGIVEVPITTGLTMRAQPTFQTSWRDDTWPIHTYDIRSHEQVQAHVLMLPLLLGLHPSRHVGVYVGPTVGVGFGHYKTDFCGVGWKRNVPYGAQADVVFRAAALGRLELGASVGFLMHNPIVGCADSPERIARIQGDEMLFSVGLTATYRFW